METLDSTAVLALLGHLADGLALGVAWVDSEGHHRFANDAYTRAFQRTDLPSFGELTSHPPSAARFELAVADRRLDVRVESAASVGFIVKVEDVTQTRASVSQLAGILEHFHDVILVVDSDLVVRWVNPQAVALHEQRRESLVGRSVLDLYPVLVGTDSVQRLRTALETGRPDHYEFQFPPSNRWFEVHLHPGDGDLTVVVRDVTERKIATEQLRRSEHLRALGRLAGGVAHEVNNQMTVITGFGSLLERRLPDERDRNQMSRILAAAERTSRVSSQLLAFSRRQASRPALLELDALLEEFRPVLERLMGSDSRLEYALAAESAQVYADRAQLEQVLLNLVSNAREAMPTGGAVRVVTGRVPIERLSGERWYANSPATAADWVMIAVEDTGEGMTAEVAARAFEPFFTTRPVGEGTGLGLSTVYGVVTTAGGVVGLDTHPGSGTRVRVALPAGLPAQPSALGTTGRGHVLLVEEEPALRAALCRALEEAGFSLTAGVDAGGALAALDGQRPGVVVVDLGLPEAPRLVRRLREGGPVQVLYVSAQPREDLTRRGMLEAGEDFLQKPFGASVLVERVSELTKRG